MVLASLHTFKCLVTCGYIQIAPVSRQWSSTSPKLEITFFLFLLNSCIFVCSWCHIVTPQLPAEYYRLDSSGKLAQSIMRRRQHLMRVGMSDFTLAGGVVQS